MKWKLEVGWLVGWMVWLQSTVADNGASGDSKAGVDGNCCHVSWSSSFQMIGQ